MPRRPIVIANWKMNPLSLKEAEKLLKAAAMAAAGAKKAEVAVCPPAVFIAPLKKFSRKVSLGAQDAFHSDTGPFTGQLSAGMLAALGAKYVILGHSERRALGEKNALIAKKLKSAVQAGLRPILCVGERERDDSHAYLAVVKEQVKECLKEIPKTLYHKISIAYEPVWAISSTANRRDATAADSMEMSIYIRKILSDMSSAKIASSVRLIYGGSVDDRDAGEFLRSGGVDGVLVGKASLDPKKFAKIVQIAEHL